MKLLLLHNRYTPDCSDIWRAAINNGWKTIRTDALRIQEHVQGDYEMIRYYGNTLHAELLGPALPIKLLEIDYTFLPEVPNNILKRNVEFTTIGKIIQPFDKKIFCKPVSNKWFEAKIFEQGEKIEGANISTDEIYLSDPIDMRDEIRCFILGGRILTASFYRINKIYDPQPVSQAILDYLQELVSQICYKFPNKLPSGVVLDFARLADNTWCLIEANEAWACGLYLCDPEKCLQVIQGSQLDKPKKVFETA